MKKPWYIWLSMLSCIYLFSVLNAKVTTLTPIKDIDMRLSFCVHVAGAWLLYVMLIPLSYILLIALLKPYIGNKTVDEILYYFIFVVLYFGGVYAAGRMYQWGHARQFLK